jgi:Carboxypeptidase regulatory-like domain
LRSRLAILLVVTLAVCLVAFGVARAQGTLTGTVTRLADGSPVAGAVVTVAGPHQPPISQRTGADGSFSFSVGGGPYSLGAGPYSVGVSATGFKSQVVVGVAGGNVGSIALVPATYIPLAAYAGSAQAVVADGGSGIFYALMAGAPEVYRTVDYGGSWRPVTMSYDDPAGGLSNFDGYYDAIASSAVSGEVAVAAGFNCGTGAGTGLPVSVSTDYGVSWRKVSGASWVGSCPSRQMDVFWAHPGAGAPDVLILAERLPDGSWDVWRADMSAASPVFVKESSDPFGQGSQIAVADSAGGSVIGRVSATGGLSFAPLAASGPITFGPDQVTGLPAPPALLRLGGAGEGSGPPDGALVVGGSFPYSAVMLSKAAGAAGFDATSASSAVVLPTSGSNACLNSVASASVAGSVAPTSTGSSGTGNVDGCWLEKSGTTLTVFGGSSSVQGNDMAYDAGYGHSGDLVSIGAAYLGPLKWAKVGTDGVPVTDTRVGNQDKLATSGTGPDSGGYSLTGITAPLVRRVAYGPAGAAEVAVAAEGETFASKNGGATFTQIMPAESRHSSAVQWWQGASGEWLTFGHYGDCDHMLSALRNWDGSSTLAGPNVAGSSCADFGGPPQGYWGTGFYGVRSLQAVAGTDTVFIGTGSYGQEQYGNLNHIVRAQLTATDPPALTNVVKLDPGPSVATLYPPVAMAYCTASSAYPALRDVLFVGTDMTNSTFGSQPTGSLLRITGATGPTPSVALVASVPHDSQNTDVHDVRVDCSTGVVYVAQTGLTGPPQTPLWKSTDGGLTFTNVTIPGPDGMPVNGFEGITAIGLNPADSNDVTVAMTDQGALYHSADGGVTWTLVRDPAVDRPAGVSDIEFASGAAYPILPGIAARAAGAAPRFALVATNNGLFDGDLAATSGLMGVSGTAGRSPGAAVRITTVGSDSHPSLAIVPATGTRLAAFQRTNGLYVAASTTTGWSIPAAIPGTRTGDSLPSLALDQVGALDLAFRRSTGPAPGIYFTRAVRGAWSAPRRLSTSASDTLPTIVVTGKGTPRIEIAFMRTRGAKRGVYYLSSQRGRWSRAVRVRGSTAADANPALAAPAISRHANTLELAFARTGRGGGIHLSTMTGTKWASPTRVTRTAGDSQPALAIEPSGVSLIIFRRTRGRGAHGLLELESHKNRPPKNHKQRSRQHRKQPMLPTISWLLHPVKGTLAGDGQASLSLVGTTLRLAFSRPSGKAPGVYYDQSPRPGRWLAKPQRWSSSAQDGNPSLASSSTGRLAIVFARG